MGEPVVIYNPEMNSGKKSLKRKRALLVEGLSKEERESQLGAMCEELNGLYKYFKEVLEEKKNMGLDLCTSVNSVIGCLLEGNSLPLSKLVTEIYEIVKDREGSVTLASVRSSVLLIGQRSSYGLPNADADVLEDDSESCLWCWEVKFYSFCFL